MFIQVKDFGTLINIEELIFITVQPLEEDKERMTLGLYLKTRDEPIRWKMDNKFALAQLDDIANAIPDEYKLTINPDA